LNKLFLTKVTSRIQNIASETFSTRPEEHRKERRQKYSKPPLIRSEKRKLYLIGNKILSGYSKLYYINGSETKVERHKH